MKRHQNVFWLPVLLLVFSLFLVACERPLQDEGVDEVPTEVADEAEVVATEAVEEAEDMATAVTEPEEASTPTVVAEAVGAEEGGAATETPAVAATVEATEEATGGEDESPRPADEGEATAEATATEEATAAATPEATTEATEAATSATEERVHVVQAGETLYRIGLQYGISWVVLAEYNNLPNANAIYAGQELLIPPTEGSDGGTPTPMPPPETAYVVQPGDTLKKIGERFGISWEQIAEDNGIVNPNLIYVGQELIIAAPDPGDTPPATHTVTAGETLFTISLLYGVAWTDIAEANNLTSPYIIYPGQTLVIPGG
jgi:LysM repeat protein